jgi:hypothetical protein
MDPVEVAATEFGLDGVRQRGHGRLAVAKPRGGAESGHVERQDVMRAGQDRQYGVPGAPTRAESVDEQERIAVALAEAGQ